MDSDTEQVTVSQAGDDLTLTIPKLMAERWGLTDGTCVTMTFEGDRLVVTPLHQNLSVDELMEALPEETGGTDFEWDVEPEDAETPFPGQS